MQAAEPWPSEDKVRQFAHGLRQCLHVIGMGVAILPRARDDEKFDDICSSMDRERREAARLIAEPMDADRPRVD